MTRQAPWGSVAPNGVEELGLERIEGLVAGTD